MARRKGSGRFGASGRKQIKSENKWQYFGDEKSAISSYARRVAFIKRCWPGDR